MWAFAENLHVVDSSVRFYGFRLTTRMAVVRLSGGRLFLYSPVFLTPELRRRLDALGEVRWLVAPNKLHHQALADYRRTWPRARMLAPPGLPERRPDLTFDGALGATPDREWADELDQVLTRGNVFFSEALFFHRPSRTLLVADLVENLDRDAVSPLGLAAARLFGVRSGPCASPEFQLYTHDPDAAAASLARARAWPAERIFLCHGRLVTRDARAVFGDVCESLIAQAGRKGRAARWLTARLAAWQ